MTKGSAPGPAPHDAAVAGPAAYLAKGGTYFQGMRADYVEALPADPGATLLEIGCSEGQTGALALARGKCARYIGIELHDPSARIAATRLSEVHVGNIEEMALDVLPPGVWTRSCSPRCSNIWWTPGRWSPASCRCCAPGG